MVVLLICNKRVRNVNFLYWYIVFSMYKIFLRWVEKSEGL